MRCIFAMNGGRICPPESRGSLIDVVYVKKNIEFLTNGHVHACLAQVLASCYLGSAGTGPVASWCNRSDRAYLRLMTRFSKRFEKGGANKFAFICF